MKATKLQRPLLAATVVASLAVVAGCASPPPRYGGDRVVYAQPPVQQAPISVAYGQVQGIDVIPVATRPSGAGAILGAVIGGVVGNQFGKGGGRAVTTIGGAVAGGVAGNAIENRSRRDDEVFRVTIRFDNGGYRDFDFREVGDLRVGDRVRLEGGQIYRV